MIILDTDEVHELSLVIFDIYHILWENKQLYLYVNLLPYLSPIKNMYLSSVKLEING